MVQSRALSKSEAYIVLAIIGIAIIAFTYSLNDYDIYLWDRNVITINDEGKTVDVFLTEGLTAKSCMNESVCYEETTDVWLNPNGQVTFHNEDSIDHNITVFWANDDWECILSEDLIDSSSGALLPGESWSIKTTLDYTFWDDTSPHWTLLCFYDELNPEFVGTITVIPGYDYATLIYMFGSLVVAFASFGVSRKYRGGEMFPRAYLFLGMAFCFWFAGDMLFFYDAYVDDLPAVETPVMVIYDPTDSSHDSFLMQPADFVYLGIYPFLALHLYLNANYYLPKKTKIVKLAIFGIPAVGAVIFFIQFGSITFESIFGALNAVGAAVTLGLVVYGARVFNNSALKPAWFLLLAGLILVTMGDFLYYQVEDFNEEFTIYSASTIVYVLAYMVMIYALYKHTKVVTT